MTIESTLKERGERYGDFADHAKIAQALQDVARGAEGWVRLDAAQRQALTVICDKIARILSGDPTYADNWHDIQGYAKLVEDRLPVSLEVTDVHAEMRKSWRKGQLWQRMGPMSLGWSDVDGEPAWSPWDMYRRSPECKWVEPKESAADVTPKSQLDLPVVELPASTRCGDEMAVKPVVAADGKTVQPGQWGPIAYDQVAGASLIAMMEQDNIRPWVKKLKTHQVVGPHTLNSSEKRYLRAHGWNV